MDFENTYSTAKPYEKAFMGGTFDRFHIAHKALIKTAVEMADYVFVGVVSDKLGEKLFDKSWSPLDDDDETEVSHALLVDLFKDPEKYREIFEQL